VLAKISGYILYFYSVLVQRTCRFTITGFDQIEKILGAGTPVIVTSWHGMTMMVFGSMRRFIEPETITIFFPDDSSGEALAEFVRKHGADPTLLNLEGDSSLNMSGKLLRVIRQIKSGKNSLIHPDGPKGPAYKVKPGITAIAKMTGATIIPLGCYCRHAYHVPRWDRYTLPLPFSKVHIQIGSPLTVSKDVKDLSETNLYLENLLNRIAAQASANYYKH
jgi:lysophospholipid acyltransferase (LPLAT)-like uncharacterized protein